MQGSNRIKSSKMVQLFGEILLYLGGAIYIPMISKSNFPLNFGLFVWGKMI